MSEHMLVHLNVVRPVGPFSAGQENAFYFFTQRPKVFAAAKENGDMFWPTHGARLPGGEVSGPAASGRAKNGGNRRKLSHHDDGRLA